MSSQSGWANMNVGELRLAAFGEGVPPHGGDEGGDDPISITVDMASEKIQTPFGMVETQPFLELFWRETGADCDGEEEEIELPDGQMYKITLRE